MKSEKFKSQFTNYLWYFQSPEKSVCLLLQLHRKGIATWKIIFLANKTNSRAGSLFEFREEDTKTLPIFSQ